MPPSLEDALLGSWPGPFGWMVIAEPVTDGQRREMVSQVALAQLNAQRLDSPRARLEARRAAGQARRAAARRRDRAVAHPAAGRRRDAGRRGAGRRPAVRLGGPRRAAVRAGTRPASAARFISFSAVPGSRSRWPGHAVTVRTCCAMSWRCSRPRRRSRAGRRAAQRRGLRIGAGNGDLSGDEDPGSEFPCAGSSRLLAALARPPAREVPGIRFTLRPDFDVTPETGLAA